MSGHLELVKNIDEMLGRISIIFSFAAICTMDFGLTLAVLVSAMLRIV